MTIKIIKSIKYGYKEHFFLSVDNNKVLTANYKPSIFKETVHKNAKLQHPSLE